MFLKDNGLSALPDLDRAVRCDERVMTPAPKTLYSRPVRNLSQTIHLWRVHSPVRLPMIRIERDRREFIFDLVQCVTEESVRLFEGTWSRGLVEARHELSKPGFLRQVQSIALTGVTSPSAPRDLLHKNIPPEEYSGEGIINLPRRRRSSSSARSDATRRGRAVIWTDDVDGDGDSDVITSLHALRSARTRTRRARGHPSRRESGDRCLEAPRAGGPGKGVDDGGGSGRAGGRARGSRFRPWREDVRGGDVHRLPPRSRHGVEQWDRVSTASARALHGRTSSSRTRPCRTSTGWYRS